MEADLAQWYVTESEIQEIVDHLVVKLTHGPSSLVLLVQQLFSGDLSGSLSPLVVIRR